ncbi:hypothetical protein D3C87_130310 [compost metagenome]
MKQQIPITIELLKFLKNEGYQVLVQKFGTEVYVPSKSDLQSLGERVNDVPFQEDSLIGIDDALSYYDELELSQKQILDIFKVD